MFLFVVTGTVTGTALHPMTVTVSSQVRKGTRVMANSRDEMRMRENKQREPSRKRLLFIEPNNGCYPTSLLFSSRAGRHWRVIHISVVTLKPSLPPVRKGKQSNANFADKTVLKYRQSSAVLCLFVQLRLVPLSRSARLHSENK